MITLVNIFVSILPVFVFLIILIFIDSFKLVKKNAVLSAIMAGIVSALIAVVININVLSELPVKFLFYSRYIAPIIEEIIKALYIIILIKRRKIGFMVDAGIYGFAIGSGFAFIENVYFLNDLQNPNTLLWIIRGFGTAVMHGGTTAIYAIMTKNILDRHPYEKWYYFFNGLAVAIVIHSFFNHFLLGVVQTTLLQLIILPLVIAFVFRQSDKALREWLELGLDVDVWLLESIKSGQMSETKMGQYLTSLKDSFPGEILVDMLCILRIHLEIGVQVKGLLLMREAGFTEENADPEMEAKFEELKYLQKSIGKAGRLAISPMLLDSSRDLWQLYYINKKS